MRTVVLAGLVAAMAWGGVGAARADDPEPKAVLLKPDQDAGVVGVDKDLIFDFPVKNTGTAPLSIFAAKADCGCMVPSYPDTIPPGATRSVKVTMKTRGFIGRTEKHVYLECDDPEQACLLLTVKATFPEAVRVAPSTQILLPVTRGKAQAVRLTLTSFDGKPFQIVTAGADRPYLKLAPLPKAAAATHSLCVQVAATAPEAGFEATVRVQTTHERCGWVTIKLFGQPEGSVAAQPARIDFGHLKPNGATPVVRLLALSRRQGAFKVLGVETADKALKVTLDKDATPRYCELEVAYVGGWTERQIGGTIIVRTDDPRRPRIEVPYTAEVW